MARIVYGVCGTGHGHAVRALTVARELRQHQFLFVTWGDALAIIGNAHPVLECENPESPVSRHRVDIPRTFVTTCRAVAHHSKVRQRVRQAIADFGATAALTDYEFIVPRASRDLGIPCLSLDHQHVLTAGTHPVGWRHRPEFWMTWLCVRWLHSGATEYLATSFYRPDRVTDSRVRIHPPLLRREVVERTPSEGEHIVAHQGFRTFGRFVPLLGALGRPVFAYGLGQPGVSANIHFRPYSEAALIDDLASCAYVVCGGGHTLISEALYLGKPVLSFPVHGQFEQKLNAIHLERLGYGRYATSQRPSPALLRAFERDLPVFRGRIRQGRRCGNAAILSAVERFVVNGTMGPLPDPSIDWACAPL